MSASIKRVGWAKRRLGIAVWPGLLLLLLAHMVSALSYYEPVPRGAVGLTRPTIRQQIRLDSGEHIVRAQLWLDGVERASTWDDTGVVTYTPPSSLSIGSHAVRLVISVAPADPRYRYDPIISEFTFQIAAGALTELPPAGPEQMRALERVNTYRKAAGLPLLTYSAELGAAASAHARYLAADRIQRDGDAHAERVGQPLYIGAGPGERAQYFAYDGGASEVIHFVDRAEEAVDGWLETIYHRIPLIHPGSRAMGYGLAAADSERINVAEFGPDTDAPLVSPWPYSGQEDVPTGWDANETPNPLALYPGTEGPVGYSISLTFGGNPRRLTLDAAELSGPDGPVPFMRFSPGFDAHLTDTVALIPLHPLAPSAAYTVYMTGQVDTGGGLQPYERRWSFTTAAAPYAELTHRTTRYTAEGTLREVTLEGSGFTPQAQLFLGGLPVEELRVISAEQLTFAPPIGQTERQANLLLVAPDGKEVIWRSFFTGQEPFTLSDPRQAFTAVALTVAGRSLDQPALLHRSGTLLLPESALQQMGAQQVVVGEIGRSYWTLGQRFGEYTMGRTAASVMNAPFTLALPVQMRSGTRYIDAEFVRRLAGGSLQWAADRTAVELMMSGATQPPVPALVPSDVAAHWAREPIVRLLQAGIVSGYGDGSFHPDEPLTRAAFMKMLVGARQLTPRKGDPGGFTDTADHWSVLQGYVGAASAAGIVVASEYPGGRLDPDRPITREEIAVMVARALGQERQAASRQLVPVAGSVAVAGKRFADAIAWRRPGYIAVAIELGIVSGYREEDGSFTFRPDRLATRAEAAVMILRALERR